jgi:hypothetical protein
MPTGADRVFFFKKVHQDPVGIPHADRGIFFKKKYCSSQQIFEKNTLVGMRCANRPYEQ